MSTVLVVLVVLVALVVYNEIHTIVVQLFKREHDDMVSSYSTYIVPQICLATTSGTLMRNMQMIRSS